MDKKLVLVLFVLLFSFSVALAVPEPPTGINAGFVGYKSVVLSWEHEGGEGISYDLYRGPALEDAALLVNTNELSYRDRDIEGGETYVYFVIAVDANGGTSTAPDYVSVTLSPRPEKPFSIVLLSPEETRVVSGQPVDFVVGVDSNFFNELHGLRAMLVNEHLGISEPLEFDSRKSAFVLSYELPPPESGGEETSSFRVVVTADVLGERFSEEGGWELTVYRSDVVGPVQAIEEALPRVLPPLAILAIGIVMAFFVRKWSLKKLVERDSWRYEIVDLLSQRALLKYDLLKKRVSELAYADRDGLLKKRISELERRLGLPPEYSLELNPFAGFNRGQIKAVGELVKTMGSQKKEMSKKEMLDWLLGRGRSPMVAEKAVELIYDFAMRKPRAAKGVSSGNGEA